MAKQPKNATTIADLIPQEVPQEAQQETPQETTKVEPKVKAKNTVKVFARMPPFVDLINDITIGETPKEVENHPWLQANINAGLLIVAE